MKEKKEKGVTMPDIVLSLMILLIGASTIFTIYTKIFQLVTEMQVNNAVMGYVTEICETIDLNDYKYITIENVDKIIEKVLEDKDLSDDYLTIKCINIQQETSDIKKVSIDIRYTINNHTREYQLNKTKIKEV